MMNMGQGAARGWLGTALAVALAAFGCQQQASPPGSAAAPSSPTAGGKASPASTGSAPGAAAGEGEGEDDDEAAPASTAARRPVSAAAAGEQAGDGQEEVVEAEDKEADPLSKTVKVSVSVEPPIKSARIYWGRKNLGGPKIELERERGSGPLDVVVRVPGFLPYHTRVNTDRDDKVRVRLYTEATATGLLGYRAPKVEPGVPSGDDASDNGLPPIPGSAKSAGPKAKVKGAGPLP